MFFHLTATYPRPFSACLSDKNQELINVYNVIRNDVEKLILSLKTHKREYHMNPEQFYYNLRDSRRPISNVGRAARFLTLNRTCFNGLYRVNGRGHFNVPFGGYPNPLICDEDNLRAVSIALRRPNVSIKAIDYETMLAQTRAGDFIYLDPPYAPVSDTASFTGYNYGGFTADDHERLSSLFRELDRKGCKVVLSNSPTRHIRSLYADYSITAVDALRAINCKGSRRQGHKELIIRNY